MFLKPRALYGQDQIIPNKRPKLVSISRPTVPQLAVSRIIEGTAQLRYEFWFSPYPINWRHDNLARMSVDDAHSAINGSGVEDQAIQNMKFRSKL